MRWHQRRVHGECQSATTVIMISSRSLAFFALMAVVAFAAAMPQPEAEAEAEAQRFYGNNNYYSSNYGYPSYYRGYNSGYGNNVSTETITTITTTTTETAETEDSTMETAVSGDL